MAIDEAFERMLSAKHSAEKRIRDEFQAKYGKFAKCDTCGKYYSFIILVGRAGLVYCSATQVCLGVINRAGYTPPPEEE